MQPINPFITVIDLSSKAKSEKELFRILTTKGVLYLPPCHECNCRYLRGIIKSTKKV